jgi:hypothetical protein
MTYRAGIRQVLALDLAPALGAQVVPMATYARHADAEEDHLVWSYTLTAALESALIVTIGSVLGGAAALLALLELADA